MYMYVMKTEYNIEFILNSNYSRYRIKSHSVAHNKPFLFKYQTDREQLRQLNTNAWKKNVEQARSKDCQKQSS